MLTHFQCAAPPVIRDYSCNAQIICRTATRKAVRLLRARNNIGESSSGSSVTTAAACPVFTVRQATSDDELEACSLIRAAAYFEAMPSPPRMVVSAQRQWARDEFYGLVRRTARLPNSGFPTALCLVALSSSDSVLGSLDLRPPATITGVQPDGVPQDVCGAFLINLAVHRNFRACGVGMRLIMAAIDLASGDLQARRLYTHVDCDNPAAWALYQRHGFVPVTGYEAACNLPGGRLCLVANLADKACLADSCEDWPAVHAAQ